MGCRLQRVGASSQEEPFSDSMGRSKSWQWDHFHQGEKANSTHSRAYCRNCTTNQVKILQDRQRLAIADGQLELEDAKDEAKLIEEGM